MTSPEELRIVNTEVMVFETSECKFSGMRVLLPGMVFFYVGVFHEEMGGRPAKTYKRQLVMSSIGPVWSADDPMLFVRSYPL